MPRKRINLILLIVLILLLIPFIAMQFTDEVNWSVFDFVLAGALLLGTGFAIDWVWRKTQNKNRRRRIIALNLIALIILWIELAVGIFGSPIAGN